MGENATVEKSLPRNLLSQGMLVQVSDGEDHWWQKKGWYSQVRIMTNWQPLCWNLGPGNSAEMAARTELTNNYFTDICTTFKLVCAEQLFCEEKAKQ